MSKKLPPIPKSINFPTGKVTVKRKKGLMENEKAFGMFHWHKREIFLDSELNLEAAWLTLFHETMHVVMMDAGIEIDDYTTERLCDTYASHRMAEMLSGRR